MKSVGETNVTIKREATIVEETLEAPRHPLAKETEDLKEETIAIETSHQEDHQGIDPDPPYVTIETIHQKDHQEIDPPNVTIETSHHEDHQEIDPPNVTIGISHQEDHQEIDPPNVITSVMTAQETTDLIYYSP